MASSSVESVRCVALPLLVVLAASGCARPTASPNVLVLSLDSVRRDSLSCYGRRPPHAPALRTTPNLDELAAEGARFTRAYSTSSWTLPSHVALMTGQPDIVHAVELDSLSLSPSHRTLAEAFAEAGYRTAGFYSGPYLDPRFGFDRGFERYEACYGTELAAAAAHERERMEALRAARNRESADNLAALVAGHEAALSTLEELSHLDVSSEVVTSAVLDELAAARADGRPWFVFAHYFDPHYDYVAPAPWNERFDPDYDGAVTGRGLLVDPAISVAVPTALDPDARRRVLTDRDREHLRALYDAEVAWTDDQIGRILDALRETGEIDRTIVVVTSDHGDEFFEHGRLGHRQNLYEESVRIPLIVRYPPAFTAGSEPDGVVSLADLFPTLLELARLPAPEAGDVRSIAPGGAGPHGVRAWAGRLATVHALTAEGGLRGRGMSVREAYVDWPIKIMRSRRWTDPAVASSPQLSAHLEVLADQERGRDRELIWIDLEQQPDEPTSGYSSDFGDPRARAALERFRARYPGWLEQRTNPLLSAPDEGQLRQLRALGYLGGDGAIEAGLVERLAISAPASSGEPR